MHSIGEARSFLACSSEPLVPYRSPLQEHSHPSRAAFAAAADNILLVTFLAREHSERRTATRSTRHSGTALRARPKDRVKSHSCAQSPWSRQGISCPNTALDIAPCILHVGRPVIVRIMFPTEQKLGKPVPAQQPWRTEEAPGKRVPFCRCLSLQGGC